MPNKKRIEHKKDHSGSQNKAISGILSVNARGTGYLRSLDKNKEDIEIQNNNLNTALNGDTVSVAILPSRKGERTAGKVLTIEKRAKKAFAGILGKENNYFLQNILSFFSILYQLYYHERVNIYCATFSQKNFHK